MMSFVAVYLGLIDEPEEEVEVDEYSSESESSEEEDSIGDMDYGNDDDDDNISEVENALDAVDEAEIPEREFDIKLNLERIGCGRFHDELVAEGFIDEVSIHIYIF